MIYPVDRAIHLLNNLPGARVKSDKVVSYNLTCILCPDTCTPQGKWWFQPSLRTGCLQPPHICVPHHTGLSHEQSLGFPVPDIVFPKECSGGRRLIYLYDHTSFPLFRFGRKCFRILYKLSVLHKLYCYAKGKR